MVKGQLDAHGAQVASALSELCQIWVSGWRNIMWPCGPKEQNVVSAIPTHIHEDVSVNLLVEVTPRKPRAREVSVSSPCSFCWRCLVALLRRIRAREFSRALQSIRHPHHQETQQIQRPWRGCNPRHRQASLDIGRLMYFPQRAHVRRQRLRGSGDLENSET